MASKLEFTLNNGLKMPALGIGTWQAPDAEVEAGLNKALEIGYRHIDAAPVYENEKAIGRVLKKWFDSGELKRADIFIVTKLPPIGNRASTVEKYLRNSLADLQLDYVDLYLIHTPFAFPESDNGVLRHENGDVVLDTESNHIETWKEMERMVQLGLTKSIGISNFNVAQVQRILDNATIKPVSLQIELHVYLQQNELVDFCKANDIIATAYSPLGSAGIKTLLKNMGIDRDVPDLMDNEVVKSIGNKVNRTPAQVLLRFILQRAVCAIPKSTNDKRLKQNIDLFDFELADEDMAALAGENQNIRVCDFVFFQGVTKHPEFPF